MGAGVLDGAPAAATSGSSAPAVLPVPASATAAGRLGKAAGGGAQTPAAAPAAASGHRFWSTQPVLQGPPAGASRGGSSSANTSTAEVVHGPIDVPKTVADVRAEPLGLPVGYEWCSIDVTSAPALEELHRLLRDNYVEDDDAMFRFAYSEAFLRWALTPPGFHADWHVGVRAGGRLVASITGVPAAMHVHGRETRLCEINFLCVHKKLRSKRLAPVLIKEVTRRVNLRGVWQAAYTAGVVLPRPVASCQYWHRSLQPKKLIDVGFSRLAPRMTMPRTQRLYALPEAPAISGLRPATPSDAPAVTRLLAAYLRLFKLAPSLGDEEVAHWLMPRPGVVDSYVVDGGAGTPCHPVSRSTVTDFISFYHLPSTIIGHDTHRELRAVYAYYIVPGASLCQVGTASAATDAVKATSVAKASVPAVGHTLPELMSDALILAKNVRSASALRICAVPPLAARTVTGLCAVDFTAYTAYTNASPNLRRFLLLALPSPAIPRPDRLFAVRR